MTVEMNTPSAFRIINDSGRRNNMGAPELEDRRLSDDIYSLNSWSENLSTSSSSDSTSYHASSSSRHSGHQRDTRSKTKSSIRKPIGQAQMKGHNSGKSGLKYSAKEFQFEATVEAVAVGGQPTNSENHHHSEEYVSDSDFSIFNTREHNDTVDGSHYQHRKPSIVNASESEGNKSSNMNSDERTRATTSSYNDNTVSVTTNPTGPSQLNAQRLYPDIKEMKQLYSDENDLAIANSPSSSLGKELNSKPQQSSTKRRSYFDFQKLPNNPRNSQILNGEHNSEGIQRTSLFLPQTAHPNHFSDQNSDISHKPFDKYKAKDDNVSNQNPASLLGRLHKSQPSIASEPHLKRQPKSSNDLESLRLSFEHRLEPENVKTKVKSVWNNIKYGWTFKSKPNFKCDSPLFLLGKCYHRQKDDNNSDMEEQFLRDFVSRIWFTYRSNFYPIPGTKLSTDCGWGCMLRSGQMLVAQCLVAHFLGRDWRLYDKQTDTELAYYREIIRWFSDPVDTPSDKTPFCVHHLANFGRTYNKDPGEWYGPASVAYIFRDAFSKVSHTVPILSQVCVYVAQDCTVYLEDVIKMCTARHTAEGVASVSGSEAGAASLSVENIPRKWQRSLIILIPIRLGGEVMNSIYIPCVQGLLSHDNCMGIIGGKPKHSLYFIGWQDDKLIYLDPHLCREAVDTSVSDFRIETYHCMTPRKLSTSKMDPSCTVGFYIRDADDFQRFVREIREFVSPPKQTGAYPLFIFEDGHFSDSPARQNHTEVDRRVRVTHYHVDQNGQRHRSFSKNSEEFVLL